MLLSWFPEADPRSCREDPTALDQMLDEGKQMPKLPLHVRDALRDYLHTRPSFRKLSKWTLLSQLTGPKVRPSHDSHAPRCED